PTDVIVIDNGSTVTMKNGIVNATINKSNATVTSLIYNGLELIEGGYGGGSIYWSWNMPNYENPSGCTYTLVTDPNGNNFDGAEIKLKMTWDGSSTSAAMDVDIYYSLQRNASGLYAAATLSHPTDYPLNPGGEWRMSSYPNPRFDWLSVDELRNRQMPSKFDLDNSVAVVGAPVEVTRLTTGIYKDKYECKYDYSADFGDIDTWGWSSTADKVGLWVTAPSKEYYPGGPDNTELMCHATPVMLNMLGGTHFGYGQETEVAAGEEWQKDFGPFLIYCNKVDPNTTNAPLALWEDAKAQAKAEQSKWPYDWHANPSYIKGDGRGSVTGQLSVTDPGNPSASAADTWVGLAIPPTGSTDVTQFQRWSKNYQFWAKTDAHGNFTFPNVIPGTYYLYAYGPGANGQLTLPDYATVTAGNTTVLGNVNWTPTRVAPTVWEIGIPDRDSREFRHGIDWWTSNTYPDERWGIFLNYPDDFPNDVNFAIGESNMSTDWNFVHYWDKDQRVESPAWNVNFNLDRSPVSASTASVYVAVAEMKGVALILSVNGTNVTNPSTGIGFNEKSNAMLRKGTHGTFNEIRFDFPASYLKEGANQISFTLRVGGSATLGNIMYDYVRLEADLGVPTSLELVGKKELIKAYPNPFTDGLYIKMVSNLANAEVQIISMDGRLVYQKQLFKPDETIRLDLSQLKRGIYLLKLTSDKSDSFTKIIKK
ncbi:MAG: T9SS type A sorting domain-containing protein, partial [Bacteroidales bacterium]|nr:T9SS type A sorting domain-containing protein [Bacteroidales bacterium]